MTLVSRPGRTRRLPDLVLLGLAAILVAAGLLSLNSVGRGGFLGKQVVNLAIGLVPLAAGLLLPSGFWRRAAPWLYVSGLALLGAVLVLGSSKKGAERWLELGPVQFQPSETAKLFTVLALAAFYAARHEKMERIGTFLGGLAIVAVPIALVLKQPHLGAALVLAAGWFAVSLVAGVRARFLAAVLIVGVIGVGIAVRSPAVQDRVLRGYQRERVAGLLDRRRDRLAKNWQTDRAEIAFGVGGLTGAGYGQGEQKAGGFVPEQHNDFVFTVVGEEGGFVGSMLVILAFGGLFWRLTLGMARTGTEFGRAAIAGIFATLGFHTVANLAMVLQLVPVVGLWLPFLSYGGTALWLCLACVGIAARLGGEAETIG